MIIQIELGQLITILLALLGFAGSGGKILLREIEKRLAARFKSLDEARETDQKHWDQRFETLEDAARQWIRLERDFLEFKANLRFTYTLRDDYVRNQTVIEAKLDSIAIRQENILLKGALKNE